MESEFSKFLSLNLKVILEIVSKLGLWDGKKKLPLFSSKLLFSINSASSVVNQQASYREKIKNLAQYIKTIHSKPSFTHMDFLKLIIFECQELDKKQKKEEISNRSKTPTKTYSIKKFNNQIIKPEEKKSESAFFANFDLYKLLRKIDFGTFNRISCIPGIFLKIENFDRDLEQVKKIISSMKVNLIDPIDRAVNVPMHLFVNLNWKNQNPSRICTFIVLLSINFSFSAEDFGYLGKNLQYSLKGIIIKCSDQLRYFEVTGDLNKETWVDRITSILVDLSHPVTLIYTQKEVGMSHLLLDERDILKLQKLAIQLDFIIDQSNLKPKPLERHFESHASATTSLPISRTKSTIINKNTGKPNLPKIPEKNNTKKINADETFNNNQVSLPIRKNQNACVEDKKSNAENNSKSISSKPINRQTNSNINPEKVQINTEIKQKEKVSEEELSKKEENDKVKQEEVKSKTRLNQSSTTSINSRTFKYKK